MSAVRYATEEERVEARRRVWQQSAHRRRDRIRNGIAHAQPAREASPVSDLAEAYRYWLDRFSMDEIRELGGGLLLFTVDDEVAA